MPMITSAPGIMHTVKRKRIEYQTALSQNADTLCMVGHHFSCMRRSVAYIYGAVSPYTIRCHHAMCMSAAYIYGTAHHVFSLAQTSLGHASSYTEATHYIDVIFVNLFQSLFYERVGVRQGYKFLALN